MEERVQMKVKEEKEFVCCQGMRLLYYFVKLLNLIQKKIIFPHTLQ